MFSDQDIWDILKILAALLHMGNIHYKGKVIDNLDATDIPDKTNVDRVAGILGVELQALIDALTSKTIFAQGETVVSVLEMKQLFGCTINLIFFVMYNKFNLLCIIYSKQRS